MLRDPTPEERILAILLGAGDRSARSDELALRITDRLTRDHFSRRRPNVLWPLEIGPGLRVLDTDSGSGTLARHAADLGAEAVALEPSAVLAAAARARSDGTELMTVVEGEIGSFDDDAGFDLVVAVDGLDASHAHGRLRRLRALTRPGGVLVIASNNPLGIRWILGYGRDADGAGPWAAAPVGGFHRRQLADELDQAGFTAQRWLFPFPDHRLPTVILDERAYGQEDTIEFIDQLVRWPCSREPGAPVRLCDDRIAHSALISAGLGPDVANSFIVVCANDRASLDRAIDPGTLAWSFTGDRRSMFLAGKKFNADPTHPVSGRRMSGSGPASQGWLTQERPSAQPRVIGPTMEQLFLDACPAGPEAVAAVLGKWRDHLRTAEVDVGEEPSASSTVAVPRSPARHPFRMRSSDRFLPANHLDLLLTNFVVDSGGLHYIDDEWHAASPVDADLVCARALWWLAGDVVHRGVAHPWPPSRSVDELTETMMAACGMAGTVDLDLMKASEAALQAAVSGLSLEYWRETLAQLGRATQTSSGVSRQLPFTSLQETLARTTASVEALEAELNAGLEATKSLVLDLDHARALQSSAEAELERERELVETWTHWAESAVAQVEASGAREEELHRQIESGRHKNKELSEEVQLLADELSALRRSWLFTLYRLFLPNRRRQGTRSP